MVVQKLIAWRGARGDDGSIPVKDAIEGVFAEVALYLCRGSVR